MKKKQYVSLPVYVEAVEFADSFKVFLPDGSTAFESREKFLLKYDAVPEAPIVAVQAPLEAPVEAPKFKSWAKKPAPNPEPASPDVEKGDNPINA